MDVPWYLQHLGLPADADQRAIKQAYARQLKRLDTANDIEGFTRLRQAYEAALRALEGEPVAAPAAPSHPPTGTAASASGAPAAPLENPIVTQARQALARLQQALSSGTLPTAALTDVLAAVRQGHLQLPAIFECLLIDALASGALDAPLEVFNAAREAFDWLDVTRLAQLGPRGQWLQQVMHEQRHWEQATAPCQGAGWFERLIRGDRSPPDPDMAAQWPFVLQALRLFPNLIPLRAGRPMLEAWQQAFAALPELQRGLAEERASAVPASPAAYRRAQPRQRSRQGFPGWAFGVAVFFALRMLLDLVGSHSSQIASIWSPPPHQIAEQTADVPRPVSLLVSAPPATVDGPDCQRVESRVHGQGWTPPASDDEKRRLGHYIRQCVQLGYWPHWRMADPRLASLGVVL